ncbi:MAG: hypothetical protein Q9228_005914, partial [Teloschistes exilis]
MPAMLFYLDKMVLCQLRVQHASPSAARPSKTPSEASTPAISSDSLLSSDGSASPTSSVAPSVLISSPLPSTISTAPDVASPPLSTDLPITPAITPALSVAGAILILTGPFYALVGIKNKWLQVFLSSAYLTSLAVTVLIVYVMHPPVSNAIQGAYLVAACMTGLIFGGGSLVFADITEALACLLGGFSLAMWFLVLVPGGLIRSTAGKAIFIGCFTLGCFGFYTSHWTRAYGMIGSTAFAGATVIVLGIDCFSRAGLKEFWLYIWGLNDDIFPLHYNGTYPITRGIRVEIAVIIICFLIGVMSQMKIWKVVKRRREEKATERLRQEELQEQAEVAIGKEIEERTAHNRVLWEGAYNTRHGNDRHVDSGISMTAAGARKELSSSNISSQGVGPSATTIELEELEGDNNVIEETSQSRGKDKTRASVTVAVAPEDDNLAIMSAPASVVTENQSLSATEIGPSQEADPSLVKTEEVETERPSFGPDAVPLPFEIPSSDFNADRRSSIAASIASDHFSTRVLDRMSGGSLRRTSSQRSQRSYTATSIYEEAAMTSHDDKDDGASSVAANVDEISDGQQSDVDKTASAVPPEPDAEENGLQKSTPSMEQHPTDGPGHKPSLNEASPKSAVGTDEEAPEALIAKHEPITGEECSGRDETPENGPLLKEEQISSSPTDMEVTTPPAPESAKAEPSLQERLADLSGTSKVMMVYRTNEWAKHLDDAEKPTTDDLKAENSTVATPTEKPAPVNIPALQQTALNASPAPVDPPPRLTRPPQSTTKSKQHSTPQNAPEPSSPYPFPQRKPPANPSFD